MNARIVVVSQIWEGSHLQGEWGKPEPQTRDFSYEDQTRAEVAMFVIWQKRMADLQMGKFELPHLERLAVATIIDDGSLEVDEQGRTLSIGMS